MDNLNERIGYYRESMLEILELEDFFYSETSDDSDIRRLPDDLKKYAFALSLIFSTARSTIKMDDMTKLIEEDKNNEY